MDKITVTQDDVEAAKDEGATFVLKELAEMVGVSDWSIQDGSESWEGDVSATAYHILVQAKVINDWDNSVARHQTDAQMAAPDALPHHAQRYLAYMCAFHLARSGQCGVSLQGEAAADSIHTIMDTLPNEILDLDFDIPAFGGCDGPWKCFHCGFLAETREEAEQHFGKTEDEAATCLASLSASNAMRDALIRCGRAVGAHLDDEVSDEFLLLVPQEVEAKIAALAGQGTTLDRQTVERVLEPDDLLPSYCRLLDAMQGDDPDAVDSAFHASIEAVSKFGLLRASMDPNHVR